MRTVQSLALIAMLVLLMPSCQNGEKSENKEQLEQTQNNAVVQQDEIVENTKAEIVEEEPSGDFKVDKVSAKTNFFDLPADKADELKKIYKTEDLTTLTEKNLFPMQDFIVSKVFSSINPNHVHLQGNYFWYVYNALPSFVAEKERHQGYYAGEGQHSDRNRLLAYSLYRMDRSPENLTQVFKAIKPALKSIITPEMFDRMNMNHKVAAWIGSYDQIVKLKDYDLKLTEIYNRVDTATGRVYDGKFQKFHGAYGFSAYDLSEMVANRLGIDKNSSLYGSPELTFWMRRNKEGNMEAVYKILSQIEGMYQGGGEY